ADQIVGVQPGQSVDLRIETRVLGDVHDKRRDAVRHDPADDTAIGGEADLPEPLLHLGTHIARHRKVELVTLLVEQEQRTALGLEHFLGTRDHLLKELGESVQRVEDADYVYYVRQLLL